MKDYYKIMNVPYDASAEDIRRAYHQFAKQYHPDKNAGQDAVGRFQAIQEAYHILSDEGRRRSFHAKTHYPFSNQKKTAPSVSSETILKQCHAINSEIRGMNRHRTNPVYIVRKIEGILTDRNIAVLQTERKLVIINQVAAQLMQAMQVLPYRLTVTFTSRLLRLSATQPLLQQQIIAFGNKKRRLRYWEQYNFLIILLATLVLCVLIVLLSD